jgi:hypothetical protein
MAALHDFMISGLKLNQRSTIPIVSDNAKVPFSLRKSCFDIQQPPSYHSRGGSSKKCPCGWGTTSVSSSDGVGQQSESRFQQTSSIPTSRIVVDKKEQHQHNTSRLLQQHESPLPRAITTEQQPIMRTSSSDEGLSDTIISKKETGRKRRNPRKFAPVPLCDAPKQPSIRIDTPATPQMSTRKKHVTTVLFDALKTKPLSLAPHLTPR